MDEIRLSDDQLKALAQYISQHHPCRFSEIEAKSIHRFAEAMTNGAWAKFTAVLEFGDTILQAKKIMRVTTLTTLIGLVLTALGIGLRELLKR